MTKDKEKTTEGTPTLSMTVPADDSQQDAAPSSQKGNGEKDATASSQKDGGKDGAASSQDGEKKKRPSLRSVLQAEAREDEGPRSETLSLKRVLGGDILNTDFVRRQIGLLLIITGFVIIYVANRYSVQQDLIQIDNLTDQLKDAKYKALASSSDLTEKCRESNVLEELKNKKDSVLKIPSQPPYIITVPDE